MIPSTALYSVAEIRQIEQAALAALPPGTLMQRAGQAAAQAALQLLAGSHRNARVLVLAGPGNNGGDALEAAAQLSQAGFRVSISFQGNADRLSPDAQQALARARNSPAEFLDSSGLADKNLADCSLAIDGLFGIGLMRPISGAHSVAVQAVNALACPVLALDVPSGLNADTGAIVGNDGIAVRATHTITFIGDKPGLHTGKGRDHAGEVRVARLDIEDSHFAASHASLSSLELFAGSLRRRAHDSHKGSYGDVAVIGGAAGMAGAPILSARAAAYCGAGRVFAGFVEHAPAYDSMHPELMCRLAQNLDFGAATLVAGPGLGNSPAAHALLTRALEAAVPAVLDADALNLIAAQPALQQKLAQRSVPPLLTPHPLEAARLLGTSSAAIQSDRLAAVRELARRFNAVVALKGSGTVIARPDGHVAINPTGNPALATAGTGDVLAGVCGALLAQRWPAWEAGVGAVWMHGAAADALVQQGVGPIGLTAGELIPSIRAILNQLTADHAPSHGTH